MDRAGSGGEGGSAVVVWTLGVDDSGWGGNAGGLGDAH